MTKPILNISGKCRQCSGFAMIKTKRIVFNSSISKHWVWRQWNEEKVGFSNLNVHVASKLYCKMQTGYITCHSGD